MLLRTYLSDFVFFSHFLSFRPLRALIFGRSGRSFFFLVLTVVKKCYRLFSRDNLPTAPHHPPKHKIQGNICKLIEKALSLLEK